MNSNKCDLCEKEGCVNQMIFKWVKFTTYINEFIKNIVDIDHSLPSNIPSIVSHPTKQISKHLYKYIDINKTRI